MIEVKIEGLAELQAELLQLPDKVGNRVLQSALTSAALPIMKNAQDRVPIAHQAYKLHWGGIANPGWLRQHIIRKKVRSSKNSAEVIITIKDQRDAYFWRFIEFGTSKMTAQPFMRPAFEAKASEAVDRFKEVLAERIEKAVTKLQFKR